MHAYISPYAVLSRPQSPSPLSFSFIPYSPLVGRNFEGRSEGKRIARGKEYGRVEVLEGNMKSINWWKQRKELLELLNGGMLKSQNAVTRV